MVRTYKALLRGNSLEWIGEAPERSEDYPNYRRGHCLERAMPQRHVHAADEMAAILEKLVESGVVLDITDPVAWQRDIRQDRPLPVERSDAHRQQYHHLQCSGFVCRLRHVKCGPCFCPLALFPSHKPPLTGSDTSREER